MNNQVQYYKNKLRWEIDSADLTAIFQDGGSPENMIVVDTRSAEAYEKEHIPGAISFPYRTMDEESVQSLNRDTLYVTYCDGIGCNASTKGALKLVELGFRVKELMGGLDWWKRDGYSTTGIHAVKGNFDVHCSC